MKILAIESSSITASAAIITEEEMTAEYTVNYKKTHSQTLLPMIDEICRMTETDLNTLDAVAVSEGPGSFTGLRIGSSTGKGLGLALDIPLISVPTLGAMAYNMFGYDGLICPMIDARRKNVYTGLYRFDYGSLNADGEDTNGSDAEKLESVLSQCLIPVEDLMQTINERGEKVVFLGDGAAAFHEEMKEKLVVPYMLAPVHMNSQRAASVAMYGRRLFEQGKAMNARDHLPEYLRPSQAERELSERNEINTNGSIH